MSAPVSSEVAGFWRRAGRILRRSVRDNRRPRYAPAVADDPEVIRRRRVSLMAHRVIDILGDLPRDYIPDILVEVAYLLNATPDANMLERMIDGGREL